MVLRILENCSQCFQPSEKIKLLIVKPESTSFLKWAEGRVWDDPIVAKYMKL